MTPSDTNRKTQVQIQAINLEQNFKPNLNFPDQNFNSNLSFPEQNFIIHVSINEE